MSSISNEYQPAPETVPQPQPPRKSRGCLYGCLFVLFSGIALLVCAGVGGYWWVSTQVQKYTSATPAELPSVELPAEQMSGLESRVNAFSDAIESGEAPPEDLVLTADEINALIGKQEQLRGKVFVRIKDGQVSGDLSIPTDPIPGGKGRYFNGSASFNVSMEEGVLIVTLADAEVNGERVPPQAIEALSKENLAREAYKDAKTAEVLRRFESISVEDDKIILKVRQKKEAEPGPSLPDASSPADDSGAVPPADDSGAVPAAGNEPS
jgi:hypothetical protein